LVQVADDAGGLVGGETFAEEVVVGDLIVAEDLGTDATVLARERRAGLDACARVATGSASREHHDQKDGEPGEAQR
jgi:hypothetical protein